MQRENYWPPGRVLRSYLLIRLDEKVSKKVGVNGGISFILTIVSASSINRLAADAASRGDLGRLAPRKKLLKSGRVHRKYLLRSLQLFRLGGFFYSPPGCPRQSPRYF